MSPSNNVGMELPQPIPEQSSASIELPPEAKQNPIDQNPTSSYESGVRDSVAQPLLGVPPPLPPQIHQQSSATNDDTSDDITDSTDISAEDKDVIEKEWVNKAKAIVNRNKEDPFKQTEELTLLKADYLQKRYNKTLKLSS